MIEQNFTNQNVGIPPNIPPNQTLTTANIPAHTDLAPYPFISALRELGLDAVLRNSMVGLIPADKVLPHYLQVARDNKEAIIAEITRLHTLAARDQADDTIACGLQRSRWEDPRHNDEAISEAFTQMFAFCAFLGWKGTQYWDGLPDPEPQRPYCRLQAMLVGDTYYYHPVIADWDGVDYIWMDCIQWDRVKAGYASANDVQRDKATDRAA